MMMQVPKAKLVTVFMLCAAAATAQPRWSVSFDGTGRGSDWMESAVIDQDGNVYVTGATLPEQQEFSDAVVIKYGPDGRQVWLKTIDGPEHSGDFGAAIGLDGRGRPTVVASVDFYGTMVVRYDADGVEQSRWTEAELYPRSAVTTGDGTTYVCGQSSDPEQMTTIRVGPDGQRVWRREFTGGAVGRHAAFSVAVDGAGNVYVAGLSAVVDFTHDLFLVKYDGDGNLLWSRNIDGPGGGDDFPVAVLLAADDSPVVVGSASAPGGDDFLVARFDPAGNQEWATFFDGPSGLADYASGASIGPDDTVVVTGRTFPNDQTYAYLTAAFDAKGRALWFDTYDTGDGLRHRGHSVRVDGAGNAYVTGTSHAVNDIGNDITTLKYSPAGERMWVTRYNGQENGLEHARGMALAPDGRSVAVIGQDDYEFRSQDLQGDGLTALYSTFGNGCTEQERVSIRCNSGNRGNKVKAKATRGTPGAAVEFCLDGGDCQKRTANNRGKAKAKWKNVPDGEHGVRIDWQCGARRTDAVECG